MNQSASDGNQRCRSIGVYTLSVMITMMGAVFLYMLTRHSVYLSFLVIWLLAHIVVFLYARNVTNRFAPPQARVAWFIVAMLICVVLVVVVRTPFTVISVGVRTVPASVEFVLLPYGNKAAGKPQPYYARRGSKNINVEFVMPAALQDARSPSVMYFGSRDRPYDIYRLSYGAEFLFWRIPLASFTGAELIKVIGVDERNSLVFDGTHARLSSRVRSKPTLQIKFDRLLVEQQSGMRRRALFMMLWFTVLVLASAAIIWSDWIKRRVFQLRAAFNQEIKA